MSVKRRDLIRYLEENGFFLFREGKSHSIYSNDKKAILSAGRDILVLRSHAARKAG